jgi:transposase
LAPSSWRTEGRAKAADAFDLSQAVRVSDLRQSRYFGLPKTHLQHVITATAITVRRLVSWLIEPSLRPTQISRFAALALQHSKLAA